MSAVITVENLAKTFEQGFFKKKVPAVRGVSFEVAEGEIFGFVGPNGAGKTTTIKMLTGLIRPTSGRATIFGREVPSPDAMQRVGFLPENPYVYPYLSPREFVEMCGALSGLSGATLRKRAGEALDRVGIGYAADRSVRGLSKGMGQRTGLAAALVAAPDLLILDEPMSGLDPVGRKEVKDLIVAEKKAGKTIFFSTHILSDVQALCDRVVLMRKGEAVLSGPLDELLRGDVLRTEVTLREAPDALLDTLAARGHTVNHVAGHVVVSIEGDGGVTETLRDALDAGAVISAVAPRQETLEDVFVRALLGGDAGGRARRSLEDSTDVAGRPRAGSHHTGSMWPKIRTAPTQSSSSGMRKACSVPSFWISSSPGNTSVPSSSKSRPETNRVVSSPTCLWRGKKLPAAQRTKPLSAFAEAGPPSKWNNRTHGSSVGSHRVASSRSATTLDMPSKDRSKRRESLDRYGPSFVFGSVAASKLLRRSGRGVITGAVANEAWARVSSNEATSAAQAGHAARWARGRPASLSSSGKSVWVSSRASSSASSSM
jgi:ABC-2 type transport system ATP-binding protein